MNGKTRNRVMYKINEHTYTIGKTMHKQLFQQKKVGSGLNWIIHKNLSQ